MPPRDGPVMSEYAGSPVNNPMHKRRVPRLPGLKTLMSGVLVAVAFFISPAVVALQPVSVATPKTVASATPETIMSLNLCADVLLLHLAEREQIASLTFLAATSPLSPVKELASSIPGNHGTAEEVIAINPDLVLVHRYSNIHLIQALENLGFNLWKVDAPATLEAAATQIKALGKVVGAEDRGEQLAAKLLALPQSGIESDSPVVAVYGPYGMTTGPGSLLHDIIQRVGLINFAAVHQLPANGRIPMETLLMQPPQALVLSGEHDKRSDTLADQTLQHPALHQLAHRIPSTYIPGRYWSCGGPEITEAYSRLSDLRDKLLEAPQNEQ